MSFINLNNRNQILNLPATVVANLTVQDLSNGIITSSNGVVSSISTIDTANLSSSLQTRLNTIESTQSSLGISDISGLQSSITRIDSTLTRVDSSLNRIDSSLNRVDASLNRIDSTLTRVDSSLNRIDSSLTRVDASLNRIDSTLTRVDASLNALSNSGGGSTTVTISDVSGLSTKLNTVDSSLNILAGISNSLLSGNSVNVSNFASSWSQLTNSPQDNGIGMAASGNGQYVMKLGWGASSYLSNDYGNTWTAVSALGSYMWAAAMSNNGQYILATTIVGGSQLSRDYGNTWSYLSLAGTPQQGKISSSGQFMVLATNSGIYYSSNYGQTFTNWTDAGTNSWTSVAITGDGSTAVAVRATTTPTIWKTTNYGASWSQIFSNASAVSFGDIACSSDGKFILVALAQNQSGFMYLSSNFGTSFSDLSGGNGLSSGNYYKIAISSSGMNMLAAGNSGFVYATSNYGQTWTQTNLPSNGYWGVALSTNATLAYAYIPGTRMYTFNTNVISLPTSQITTPGRGSVYFDQTTNKLYVYNTSSSSWKSITLA